jgi:hypothetical protein
MGDHLAWHGVKDDADLHRLIKSYPEAERKIFDDQKEELDVLGGFAPIGPSLEQPTTLIVRVA